jgi:Transposase and inactivated derivatives
MGHATSILTFTGPQLTANTTRVWHFGHAEIAKNTARLKANAIGFYVIVGQSVTAFLPRSTQTAIAEFLAAIRAANTDYCGIIVVLDNFSSHHAAAVIQAAKDNAIKLIFLPPYSSDLNPIEFTRESIERVISVATSRSINHLRRSIGTTFAEGSPHCSYAKSWIKSFVPDVVDYKRLYEWL